jgi:hypothetical protein
MAMLMSTADSYINSSSVLFAHDFCVPLNIDWAKKNELLLSRIAAVVIGVFALIISLSADSLFDIIVIMASFYMPLVTVPLFLAIFGFRTSTKTHLFGILVAFTLTVLSKFIDFGVAGSIVTIITIFIVTVSIIIFHYLLRQPGGWGGIKDRSYLEEQKLMRHRRWNKFIDNIYNFNFISYCKSYVSNQGSVYIYFAGFCMIVTYTTMFLTPSFELLDDQILMFSYVSVLLVSVSFIIVATFFPEIKKKIILQYCGC